VEDVEGDGEAVDAEEGKGKEEEGWEVEEEGECRA
jgi:hypothetical protein